MVFLSIIRPLRPALPQVAALAAAAALLAVPASASARSCGSLTVHLKGFRHVGWHRFTTTNMSCAAAARVMRVIAAHPQRHRALGFTITNRGYRYHGRNGARRFTCVYFG